MLWVYDHYKYSNSCSAGIDFSPYSADIDFSRQNLTTKVDPRTARVEILLMAVDPYIDIQMNRKELTKTFMMISR